MTTMQNSAACCQVAPGASDITGAGGPNSGVALPALAAIVRPNAPTFGQKIEQALQAAIHGTATVTGGNVGGSGFSASRTNVIPFPMVDPYKPIRRAGRPPVAGYTAFPAPESNIQPARNKRVLRLKRISLPGGIRSEFVNVRGNDEREAAPEVSGFGDAMADAATGIGLGSLGFSPPQFPGTEEPIYSSSPGRLQTILGTIQATLPATIQALRANPQNIYPSQSINPYAQNAGYGLPSGAAGAGADVGARAGAAVGNVGDTISQIVAQHPFLVLAGGAALVLLFMNPPRRR